MSLSKGRGASSKDLKHYKDVAKIHGQECLSILIELTDYDNERSDNDNYHDREYCEDEGPKVRKMEKKKAAKEKKQEKKEMCIMWHKRRDNLLSDIIELSPRIERVEIHSGNSTICEEVQYYSKTCNCPQTYNKTLMAIAKLPLKHVEYAITENTCICDSLILGVGRLPLSLESLRLSGRLWDRDEDSYGMDDWPQYNHDHMKVIEKRLSALPNLRQVVVNSVCTIWEISGGKRSWKSLVENLSLEFAENAWPVETRAEVKGFLKFITQFKETLRVLRIQNSLYYAKHEDGLSRWVVATDKDYWDSMIALEELDLIQWNGEDMIKEFFPHQSTPFISQALIAIRIWCDT